MPEAKDPEMNSRSEMRRLATVAPDQLIAEIERLVAEGRSLADKLAATDLLVSRLRDRVLGFEQLKKTTDAAFEACIAERERLRAENSSLLAENSQHIDRINDTEDSNYILQRQKSAVEADNARLREVLKHIAEGNCDPDCYEEKARKALKGEGV